MTADAADLLFYVSGHGFGHASRMTALLATLRARAGTGLRLHVRTDAPAWMFQDRDPAVRCSRAAVDVGVIQPNGLDLDLAATLAAHEALGAVWEERVAAEADFVRASGARLVVGDVPPLAFAAAARAGVPAVAVANFGWDWILALYAEGEPRWAPILARYREAYGRAHMLFRLPLHGDLGAFPRVVDVPLLVRRSTRDPAATRAALGITAKETRPVVLVSFGGFGHAAGAAADWDALADFVFVGFGERPEAFPGEWIALPHRSPIPHEDLVATADAVIGKPGYGTVAEIRVHARRFLYVPRERFREMPILEAALAEGAAARRIARADFERGRWRAALEALLQGPPPPPPPRADGAEVIAEALLELLAERATRAGRERGLR